MSSYITQYGNIYIALLCGDPGVPGNGRKTITTHTIGSEVLFTCEPGYSLVGNNVRICQPDQTWSGSIPLCVSEYILNCFVLYLTLLQ